MYDLTDIKLTADGDLQVSGNGDLKLGEPADSLSQEILFRIKTKHGDYTPYPFISADTPSFIGEPNTERTANFIQQNVSTSLTEDGLLDPRFLIVRTMPVSIDKIAVVVMYLDKVEGLDRLLNITHIIDINSEDPDNESILNTSEI